MEEDKSFSELIHRGEDSSHGWQKVTYVKKRTKASKNTSSNLLPNGSGAVADKNGVFKAVEKNAEDRRRILDAKRAASSLYDDDDGFPVRSNRNVDDDDEDYPNGESKENIPADANKKDKPKKVKSPKVTVAEAAAKIDADDLAAFLSSISESYEGQPDIQLMRFADYFGRAFSAVSAAQFPWLKLFRESPLAKIADIPLSHISESVYKTSVDWINQCSSEALDKFVLWSLDGILADMATQQPGSKSSKKGGQPASSKAQVAIFVVSAMVLRRKPDVLVNLLPKLRENSKYQGQDKLPVLAWMIVQACVGDLAVALYVWAHHILPILGGKSGSNPQSRDLVLQLVERILAVPKARGILLNSAVRKGERLMPPSALDLLLRVTFPSSSARVKATERFEAIYPVLKEVALAGSPGSKGMKQVSLQIQTVVVKAAGEGIPALSQEATNIFIWCLSQNSDCYKQWDKIYVDNIEASVATLRKLSEEWKRISLKQSSYPALGETLKKLSEGVDAARQTYFKDADKYCKAILGRVSRGGGCAKTMAFILVLTAAGVGAAVVYPSLDAWDWDKLSAVFNT
ncbi:hypothetical protein MIMGU_mgv1a003637mg [Erythranthe guttata]|uniref:Uncharacterized protein n=1 Tax=Erythranthe guttata TaxID=4155 RepID=A0A022QWU1_ERYGU|nr:hypothetical protein MIMGU_mgv1a003637mg [Erythranthe guttata]